MILSDEKIKEFQEIYKEHFGIEISKEDAYKNGIKLLQLIKIIYKPTDKGVDIKKKGLLTTKNINKKHERTRNI